jgi:hypothetical protein
MALFNHEVSQKGVAMKKLNVILTTLLFLVLSSAGFAQGTSTARVNQQPKTSVQNGHQEMISPEAMVDHLSTQLSLTEDQRAKIKPIAEDVYKRMDEVRQDNSLSEQERGEEMKQIHENALGQVKTLLNPDQQKKLDEMMSSHGHHGDIAHSHAGQDQSASNHQHQ